MTAPFTYAVLTVSDRCYAGTAPDRAGPELCRVVEEELGGSRAAVACVPDEVGAISAQLEEWAGSATPPALILTTGGTGLGPRDVTPEATRIVLDREHPGLAELARLRGGESTPLAFLSRGLAGTIGGSLVVNLPGSERGAVESLRALLDVLPHAVHTMAGGGHGDGYEAKS